MTETIAAVSLLSGVAQFDGSASAGLVAESVPSVTNCTFSMWAHPTGNGMEGKT